MKITDRFVGDHKTFRKLMTDIRAILEAESPVDSKGRLSPQPAVFESFAAALNAHMDKEERELFPFSENQLGADALERMSVEADRRRSQEAPRIVRRPEGSKTSGHRPTDAHER